MKKGFTLAEVLITLGIVGIVAVLTIPGVMKNYKNRLYVAQLEKVYAQIADAAQAIMNDEHVDNFYETTAGTDTACTDRANGKCEAGGGYFLTKYFKTIKSNCAKSDKTGCMTSNTSTYKNLNGGAVNGVSYFCVQTTSGAAICEAYTAAVGGVAGQKCLSILVDVNGMAEPNIAGRDVFSMDIHKNGTISDYNSGCVDNANGATAASCGTNGGVLLGQASGCLTNIIEAGWKMEY